VGPALVADQHATVLVVEDNKAVRELIERVLVGAGYTVHSAGTPAEAREICANSRGKIDLMLTDVVMPDMNGPVLARQLRAARPEMKLILMSGYSGAALQQRDDGMRDVIFLEKPFSSGQVLRAVRSALRDEQLSRAPSSD
jgi:two-component system cell cycle sensor histidine kinase/response regulator CckA